MLVGKHVNKYYKKYWYFFLLGIIGLVFVDIISLFIPEYLGKIIDLLVEGYNGQEIIGEVAKMSLYILFIGVGMMGGRILWRLAIFSASKRIEMNIRQEMFDKATRLAVDFYHENKVGTIMAWFTSDVETIEEYFSWGTVMLVDAFFLSILVVIKMFMLNWMLSILSIVPLILIVVWGAIVEKAMSRLWNERQVAYDKLYDFSEENFTGIRVIKAFVKEKREIRAFAKVAKNNAEVNISFVRISVIFDIIIEVLLSLISFLILAFGGYLVYLSINNQTFNIFGASLIIDLSAGQLIEFYGYFDSIIWPLIALGQIITMRARAKTSLTRISRFLDAPENIKSPDNAVILKDVKGKITFKDFSFKFSDGKDDALKNISFEILPGERVGIIGKVGCGKSTLANVLCRLYNIEKGQVFIDDVDIMDIDIPSLRKAISYVPQDNFLFSDTVKNNIAFSNLSMKSDAIKKAAKFANVDSDIEHFEKGYETLSGERGVTLSGGQKQRISIARAYLKDSPIMILDDSVSAVDVSTEEAILNNIDENRNNKTTIVIASRVSTVANFDKILVLNDGKVEAYDSPKNLLNSSETYRRMVYFQKLEKEVEDKIHG